MPEIIAHRGGASLWPENSLLALRGALALGVDQVQLDVHLSADGEVVVLHDATLERTTEGSGPVHLRSWAELSAIPLRDAPNETVPSLTAMARAFTGSNARLRLELKRVPDPIRSDLPDRVLETLKRAGVIDRTIITSFDTADLQRAHELAPAVPLALLLDAPATTAWSEASAHALRRIGCATIGVRHDRISPAFRNHPATAGLRVCYFGTNDFAALETAFAAHPDEISTDRPDLALRLRAGDRPARTT